MTIPEDCEKKHMEALFVYGTLQDPATQQHLIGRIPESEAAVLPGYHKHTDSMYPVALPQEGAAVDGQVLRVTPEELAILDKYEGDAYERVRATLKNGTEVYVYQGKSTDE
jgi:gamma-glutamylcyclotransferase (GGCT)/AIG2-like uncharacterized protein YtfP